MFPFLDEDFLVLFLFSLIVFSSAHRLLLCWHISSLCLSFLHQFLCICLSVPLILVLLYYIYFPRLSLLSWPCPSYKYIALLLGTLALLSLLLFLHMWNGTMTISTLYPCFNVFVTFYAVFTFFVLCSYSTLWFSVLFSLQFDCLVPLISLYFYYYTLVLLLFPFFVHLLPIFFFSWLFNTSLVALSFSFFLAHYRILPTSSVTNSSILSSKRFIIFPLNFWGFFHIFCGVCYIFHPF